MKLTFDEALHSQTTLVKIKDEEELREFLMLANDHYKWINGNSMVSAVLEEWGEPLLKRIRMGLNILIGKEYGREELAVFITSQSDRTVIDFASINPISKRIDLKAWNEFMME